ncbi:SLAP domain-containing protein [Clostridium sp. JS66]|uniref:SLAP domain-containing protein n=1 Tax=Clostridium sp. JS66 TaxID=3064705 RepID=UPI00298D7AAD|nr:SLAP domain-containing protein [Clostridium sp. JS66]WPC42258.1 SLAP domain-containing protein [Clostridium sp. JS66]
MSEEKQNVEMELSLTERFEAVVSEVQKDIMNEEISGLEPIKESDINISTIYAFDDGDEIEAKVYFRNGLSTNINFEYVSLVLVNSNEEVVASKVFDLREMGDIPIGGARPWKLCFEKSCVDMEKFSPENCKVLFNKNIKAVNYAKFEFEDFPEEFNNFKGQFQTFLENLPNVEKGKFTASAFNISLRQDGKLIVTIIMRNSVAKVAKVEEIPITIKDESDNVIAKGRFQLKDFTINPMKAKVCVVAFETNLNPELGVDTSKWKAVF